MAMGLLAVGLKRAVIGLAVAALFAAPAWRTASAQDYPSRVVSLVVAFPAGGGVDLVGRVIAQKLTEALGQQVIVINRPGAGSVIGTRDVAKSGARRLHAAADGDRRRPAGIPVTTSPRISRRSA